MTDAGHGDDANDRCRSRCRVTVLSTALFILVSTTLAWQYHSSSSSSNGHHTLCYSACVQDTALNQSRAEEQRPPPPAKPKLKVILFWVPFFSSRDYYFGLGHEPFVKNRCPVDQCETTDDRSRVQDSDAIVFHIRDVAPRDLPKPPRLHHQRWTFFLLESPDNTALDLRPLRGLFNWTVSYRADSDVLLPYFNVTKLRNASEDTTTTTTTSSSSLSLQNGTTANTFQSKAKAPRKKLGLVSWLVSHCHTTGQRERYAAELMKYVPVDTYGGCGRPCPRGGDSKCQRKVFTQYKFYLSFENSVCRDYVTEKFSNTLQYDIVPIVYGGADYGRVAPPHSFIDVRDFASPRHLAEYLLRLDNNDTLYGEYFAWKSSHAVRNAIAIKSAFCDLCAKLHRDRQPKVYSDIHDWWTVQGDCRHKYPPWK